MAPGETSETPQNFNRADPCKPIALSHRPQQSSGRKSRENKKQSCTPHAGLLQQAPCQGGDKEPTSCSCGCLSLLQPASAHLSPLSSPLALTRHSHHRPSFSVITMSSRTWRMHRTRRRPREEVRTPMTWKHMRLTSVVGLCRISPKTMAVFVSKCSYCEREKTRNREPHNHHHRVVLLVHLVSSP